MSACKNCKMVHGNLKLKFLCLLAGSVMAFSPFPPPLILLDDLSDHVTEGDSLKIACFAPRKYVDVWFFLFKENKSTALQTLPAAEDQHAVSFLLEDVTTSDGGWYKCQYGLYNGSQLQKSEFSHVLEIIVEGPDRVLPIVLSVTGVLLLVLILFVAVRTVGFFKERRKKKRELKSCWTETSYPTTETSFGNCTFNSSVKSNQEVVENPSAWISSATGPRLVSRISLEKPEFSTFRASE